MLTAIIFLIVLAVLIFVHELGHFIAARIFGIRVDAFKLGFGPKLFHWTRGGTEYGVNLIPFGGYVKIFGETPNEESMLGPDHKRSFVNKPRWQQVVVLAAGVFFNFLFAWLLYVCVFTGGVTATTDGFEKYAANFHNNRTMITYVEADSPADKAGVKVGDTILQVMPASTTKPLNMMLKNDIESIQSRIASSSGQPITVEYTRQDKTYSTKVTPVEGLVEGKYAIGIAMSTVGDLKLPFFTAIWEGFRYTGFMIRDTAVGLYTFVASIFHGTANFADVSGPVGIAGIVGNAAEMGITYLFMITALISINLGVINFVPFPALDGGRILFAIIEGIIRRPIPFKWANVVNTIGFVLLMILMVVVTFRDVLKLFK